MLVSSLLAGFNSDFSFYLKLLKLEVNELNTVCLYSDDL